jgi:putative phage-type endonuclease
LEYVTPENFPQATHLGNFESDSPEWHEARKHSIGGSEIGTIMGLNPWESAYTLWAKKLELIPNSFQENWAIRLGKAFEEPILKLFGQQHPELEIYRAGSFVSKEFEFMHANPDAMARNKETGEWIVIEIKTARYNWDALPAHYACQVQHYMHVMGVSKAIVVAVAGMDWFEYEVEADEFVQLTQADYATMFHKSLTDGTRPEWDGSESTYQTVRQQHPQIDDTEVELGTLGLQLKNAQAMLEESQSQVNLLKSMVLDTMQYAKTGFVLKDGQKIKIATRQARRDGVPYLVIHK